MEQVRQKLSIMKGVEVNSFEEENKMLVVIYSESMAEKDQIAKEIRKIDGVLTVNLAYHHFDGSGTHS